MMSMMIPFVREMGTGMVVATTLIVILMSLLSKVAFDAISYYLITPLRIKRIMHKQGVRGPKPRLLTGNISDVASLISQATSKDMDSINHDVVYRLAPHFAVWSEKYGKRFMYWNGFEPRMCLMETELIKELLSSKHNLASGRSWLQREGTKNFIGRGLLMANGQEWYHQRHIAQPAFTFDKLKKFTGYMVECTTEVIEKIERESKSGEKEIEIGEYMAQLTADIISRTEFGSSFEKGKRIFNLITALQPLCAQSTRHLFLPGSRFIPNKYNRKIKSMKKEVEKLLMEIIQARKDSVEIGRVSSFGSDLLGVLLNEMQNNNKKKDGFNLTLQLIMDECKTFFFAGHDTTANLLTWSVMLLAANPSWQDKVRAEVKQVCDGGIPHVDQLSKLPVLTAVINEALRLYPPATIIPRTALEDIQLSDLFIPKGLSIWIPAVAIHHSKELWGEDANEFNPERFMSKATAQSRYYFPFSSGPRNCIGQPFAMMEAKIILSMMISKFSFTVSESYRHAPVVVLTIKPKHGVQVYAKPLDS